MIQKIKIWGQSTLHESAVHAVSRYITYRRLMAHIELYGFKSIQYVGFDTLEEIASVYPNFAKKLAEPDD